MEPVQSLSDLLSTSHTGTSVEVPGTLARTFGQTTLSTTLPMSKLFSIYEIDLEVQRQLIPKNVSRLVDYILLYLDHGQNIYFPGVILSARGAGRIDAARDKYFLSPVEDTLQRQANQCCQYFQCNTSYRISLLQDSCSSNKASISTGILSGSDPKPTALLTPTPFSSPQTCAKSSLQPLIT